MQDPDWWDPYSCQPYKLPPAEKPRLSWANLLEYGKVLGIWAGLAPFLALHYARMRKGPMLPMSDMAGLGINAENQWQSAHEEMVDDLGVRNLLLRIPSWETCRLDHYRRFIERFPRHNWIVNILQSRDSVSDPAGWERQVHGILEHTHPQVRHFQICNAINRTKWGCHHSGEALTLFRIAEQVSREYPDIRLLGSSVIDFEPLVTLRTLVNTSGCHYDACAAQLYINRRGSVEGRQFGYFNLKRKIRLIRSMLELSSNTDHRLWITETNWPLLGTKPYTPNSGHPRSTVDEDTQAKWLKDYFTVARNTGWVERVYWWQLINPGYGLVDHRGGRLRKMPSYFAFRSLLDADNQSL